MPLLYTEHSLDFDGSDDYVSLGDVSELSFERTDAFSLSGWAKITASTNSYLISKTNDTAPLIGWGIYVNGGQVDLLIFNDNNQARIRTGVVLKEGTWHHIAGTSSGSGTVAGLNLYIDGELVSVSTIDDDLGANSILVAFPALIGAINGGFEWDGRISEVSVYDKELSFVEVATIYNAGSPPDLTSVGPTGNLVGYWRPGEHSYPTVPDLSPSGNDGTMTNMAANDIVVDAPRPLASYYSIALQESLTQYVTMGFVSEVNFTHTDAFSISVWYKAHSPLPTDGYLVSQITVTAPARGWGLRHESDGALRLILYNDGVSNGITVEVDGSELLDGEWHYVVATYDGSVDVSGTELYIDGTARAKTTVQNNLSATIATTTNPQLNINSRQNGAGATASGSYTGLSIWARELTPSDVTAFYNGGVPTDVRTYGYNSTLRGYWVVQRTTYPTITDLSSAENPGTCTSTTAADVSLDAPGVNFVQPTATTQSVEFETVATAVQRIQVSGGTASLPFDRLDRFSFACWFRSSDQDEDRTFIAKLKNGNAYGYWFFISTEGKVTMYMASSGGFILRVATVKAYDDNFWHHACATMDGTATAAGVRIYIDGVSVPVDILSDALTGGTVPTGFPVWIGYHSSFDRGYRGFLSHLVVYDKTLSEAEVRTLYGARGPTDVLELLPTGNLKAYWPLGDGDTFPTVTDVSGNGLDGTMIRLSHYGFEYTGPVGGSQLSLYRNETLVTGSDTALMNFEFNQAFSVSFWYRTTSSGGVILSKYDDSGNGIGWFVYLDSNGSRLGAPGLLLTPDRSVVFANEALRIINTGNKDNGAWRHAVLTYDGSGTAAGILGYLNGASQTMITAADTLSGSILNSALGQWVVSQDDRNICQVAIYDKELTSGEVTAIYGAGTPPDLTSVGPTGNLHAYWPSPLSEQAQLPLVLDASGNGYDLNSNQAPVFLPEVPAPFTSVYSVEFDGVNDSVTLGTSVLAFARTDAFTLSCWLRLTASTNGYALTKINSAGSLFGWGLYVNGGQIDLILLSDTNQARIRTVASYPASSWVSVIGTSDGSGLAAGMRLYVNGVEASVTVVQDNLGANSISSTGTTRIGARDGGFFFQGHIDEVAVYNRVLAPSEANLFGTVEEPLDHTAYGPVDNLIGYWRMGDPGPAVYPNLADFASATDHPGTMSNMDAGDIVSEVSTIVFTTLYLDYVYTTTPIGPDLGTVGTLLSLLYVPVTEISDYYKMRALADPGPGYVTWVVDSLPDYTGTFAPASIQGGSAVVSDLWGDEDFIYSSVSTEKTLSTVSGPSVLVDPQGGLLFIGVDTSQVTWSDLDTITLPASSQIGSEILIKDVGGEADTKRITVNGNGNNIDGQATRLISNPQETLHVVYGGSQWSTI